MKKLLIGIIIIVALGAGAMFYLSSNGNGLIRDAVVEYMPPILGADVQLAGVNLDASNGTAALNGMVIGNPEGFKSDHLFKMDQFLIKMDVSLENLTSDVIRISEIRLDGADMIYEIGTNGNNVGKIQENIDKYIEELGVETSEEESEKKFIVDNVYVNGTNVKVSSDLLAGRGLGFPLPDLHLTDIGKKENGAVASDVVKQIFGAISGSVTKVAQSGILGDALGGVKDLGGNVVKQLEDKVVDKVGSRLKGLIPN